MAAEIGAWRPCPPEVGAVVALRNSPGVVNHVGIIVGPGQFLHTLKTVGAHLDWLYSPRWRQRVAGTYAWTE
jgi:cell wall-associated NlpC family hydrolase